MNSTSLSYLVSKIFVKMKEILPKNYNFISDQYCKNTVEALQKTEYTAETFPFRYTITDSNISIDGISAAGLADDTFNKENLVINGKYKIDDTIYTVNKIGADAFSCKTHEGATAEEIQAIYKIKTIQCPLTVKTLGSHAFGQNEGVGIGQTFMTGRPLERISGLDNVDTLEGTATFVGCSNITKIFLPKITTLVSGCFGYCSKLEEITLGNITSIPQNLCVQCFKLKSIKKVDGTQFSITTIGNKAFYHTESFKNFDFNPSLLISIGNYAFKASGLKANWAAAQSAGCQFGTEATRLQRMNETMRNYNFVKTPCNNSKGNEFCYNQSYNGWYNFPLGASTENTIGNNGCTWIAATTEYNALTSQNLTPPEFNHYIMNASTTPLVANGNIAADKTKDVIVGPLTYRGANNKSYNCNSAADIQRMYDDLATGAVLDGYIYEEELNGAHAVCILGVDENGDLLLADGRVNGRNKDNPICEIIHIDFLDYFTSEIADGSNNPEFLQKVDYTG